MEAIIVVMTITMFGVVLAGAFRMQEAQLEQHRSRMARLAGELGLSTEADSDGKFRGRVHDIPVRLSSKHGDEGGWIHIVEVEFAEPVARGIRISREGFFGGMLGAHDVQLGTELDPELRVIAADDAAVREQFSPPSVTSALKTVLHVGGTFVAAGSFVQLQVVDRGSVRNAVDAGVALSMAMETVNIGPWRAQAEHLGLELEAHAMRLHGRVRGVAVDAKVTLRPSVSTVIVVRLTTPLPAGTLVRAKRAADQTALGDPVLDKMVGVDTPDLDTVRQRIANDEVRGALLDVVCGNGGRLEATAVVLEKPYRLGPSLPGALDAMIALARGLG